MVSDIAYAELGLAPGASEREAKDAWRRLASLWHPDRNRSAAAAGRMQRINQAFEALREAGFPARPAGRPAPAATPPAPAPTPAPTPPPARARATPAQDEPTQPPGPPRATLHRKLRISLEEAALGCTRLLRGKRAQACPACEGQGQTRPTPACAACQGAGQVRQAGWYGLFSNLQACAACHGSGQAPMPCAACAGRGRTRSAAYQVTVRLPAGVRDGDELVVDGRRLHPSLGLGDLVIRVALQAHPFFRLDSEGALHCQVPVNGHAWAAGHRVMVPTPTGLQALGLVRDQLDYLLPGQGFPSHRRGPRGALRVQVCPYFQTMLTPDQQILLDQLIAATSSGPGAAPQAAAWQQTLRDWERHRPQGGAEAPPGPAEP